MPVQVIDNFVEERKTENKITKTRLETLKNKNFAIANTIKNINIIYQIGLLRKQNNKTSGKRMKYLPALPPHEKYPIEIQKPEYCRSESNFLSNKLLFFILHK